MADETTYRFVFADAGGPVAAPAASASASSAETPPVSVADTARPGAARRGSNASGSIEQLAASARSASEALAEFTKSLGKPPAIAQSTPSPGIPSPRQTTTPDGNRDLEQGLKGLVRSFEKLPAIGTAIDSLRAIANPILDAAQAIKGFQTTSAVAAPAQAAAAGAEGAAVVPAVAPAAGLAAAAGPLIVVGAAAAAAGVALYATARAAKAVDRAWLETANRLSGLSSALSASQARAAAAQTIQDVRSARNLGPELAQYTTARASIDRSLQRISDAISKAALEKLAPLVEKAASYLEVISEHQAEIETASTKSYEVLSGFARGDWPAVYRALTSIQDDLKQNRQELQRANDKNATDLFTLFEELPELPLGDPTATPGPYRWNDVAFDAVGGRQLP